MANKILSAKLIASLVDRVSGPARAAAGSLGRLRQASAANAKAMDQMRGRMLAAVGMGYVLAKALSSPIKAAMEFESALADINKVVDFKTPDGLKQMSADILEMSLRIPVAATGLADIVAAAGQAGMQSEELLKFTEIAAKVGVAFGMTADETGTSLAKIKTALGLTVDEVSALSDALNHLSNTSASEAPALLSFMRRVGSVGKQYGFTAEQTAAIGSAMIAAGAHADVAATSFRNVGRALAKGDAATKRQDIAFKKLGLSAVEVSKALQKDAVGTLNDVIARIRALPRELQATTVSQLFGDEARAIMPLIENTKLLANSLDQVAASTNFLGSAQKEFEVRTATFENRLQLFQNRLTRLQIVIGNALLPALTSILGALEPLIDKAAALAAAYPQVTAAVIGLTAGLIALKVATIATRFAFLFAKGGLLDFQIAAVAAMGKLVSVSKTGLTALAAPFGFYGRSARRAARQTATLAAAQVAQTQKAYASARALEVLARKGKIAGLSAAAAGEAVKAAGHAASAAQKQLLAANAALTAVGGNRKAGTALLSLLNPLRLVKAGFAALRLAVIGTGIGAVVVGLAAAGIWIHNNWSGIAEMFTAFGSAFMKAIEPIKPALDPIISVMTAVYDKVSSLLGPVRDGSIAWKDMGTAAGKAVGDMLVLMVELPGKIITAIGSIDFSGMVADFASAGAEAGDAIIDAIISAFDKLWQWLATLPSRIMEAIGQIDLSGIISWPSLPSIFGGGSASDAPAGVDGARAKGGPVSDGRTYLVGERGPELFIPKAAGMIMNAQATARRMNAANSNAAAPRGAMPQARSVANAMAGKQAVNASSGGGRAREAPNVNIQFGDIHLANPPGASPEELQRSFGDATSAEIRSHFSDVF